MNNNERFGMKEDGSSTSGSPGSMSGGSARTSSSFNSGNVGSPGMSDYGLNVGNNTGTPFGSSSTEWSATSDFSRESHRSSGIHDMLNRFGMGNVNMGKLKDVLGTNMSGRMGNVDMKATVDKARGYAAANPGKVLGGLAALAIGLGMMRGRGVR